MAGSSHASISSIWALPVYTGILDLLCLACTDVATKPERAPTNAASTPKREISFETKKNRLMAGSSPEPDNSSGSSLNASNFQMRTFSEIWRNRRRDESRRSLRTKGPGRTSGTYSTGGNPEYDMTVLADETIQTAAFRQLVRQTLLQGEIFQGF
jgi:hypothetical protein